MIGKLIAGLVCGAAAAVPGRYFLETTIGAMQPLMGNGDDMALAIQAAPFAVGAMVVVIALIAPNIAGAWLRGALIAAVVGLIVTVQALQCFGFDYLFGEVLADPISRDAAMIACPDSLTPMVAMAIAAGAVAFGVLGIMVWRGARRDHDL